MLGLLGVVSFGVAHAAPPACEVTDEVNRAVLAARFAAKSDADRATRLRALLGKYPDDLFAHEAYADAASLVDYPATRAEYAKRHEQQPTHPVWAYVDALLVSYADRQEGESRMRAVTLPRAHFRLAGWFANAKDMPSARREIDLYNRACPGAITGFGIKNLATDKADRLKEADTLRGLLRERTDVAALTTYSVLWKLESQTMAPSALPVWRKTVAADVARLRAVSSAATIEPALARVLEEGYQIVSDRDGLAWVHAARPKDATAFWQEFEAWTKTHAAPATKASRADRTAYMAAQHAASAEWVKTYANVESAWAFRLETAPRTLPVAEVKALAARVLAIDEESETVASEYAARGIELERAIAMTLRRLTQREKEWANVRSQPVRFAWRLGELENEAAMTRVQLWSVLSQAYFAKRDLPHTQEIAEKLGALLTTLKPDASSRPGVEINYWTARGRAAWLGKKSADALGFFLKAHALEPALDDTELQRLWKEMGGSDESYALLGGGVGGAVAPVSEWKAMEQALPALALEELSGKKWRSADWRGKTVVMVVWATWCGPCKEELPHLEKLHQAMKGRNDVVIVSLNVDDQLGLIEPFLAEKKYTFPVLLAADWGRNLRGGGIPITWIADGEFRLRRERRGYTDGDDWVGEMRTAIDEIAKAPKK